MDIVFVIDASGSIRRERFQIVKDFVKDIVDEMEIGSDKTRVGVVSWSDNAKLEVGLHISSTQITV